MPLELEQERAGVWAEVGFTIRCQDEIIEQLRIQESRIGLTGLRPVPRLFGKGRDRNLLPDLKTHLKVFRDLCQIPPKLIRRWRAIERGVITDSPEERFAIVLILAILTETFSRKRALRVLPLVDLPLPPFVSPGGGPESN